MQNQHNQKIGKLGETLATNYLTKNGYIILHKNYKTRYTELDIIAKKDLVLVFCEVKTKVGHRFGQPYEAVNQRKLEHLSRSIQYFLLQKRIPHTKLSLDVISIVLHSDYTVESIKHFPNISTKLKWST